MFPDTEIAKTYGQWTSGCTKTNILVETLVSDDSSYIASQMQNQLVSIDPKTWTTQSLCPVTVRYVYLCNILHGQ